MKAHELAELLLLMKNKEVMFSSPNDDSGPFTVSAAGLCTVKKDEFPDEYEMPAGFEYINLYV